MIDDVNQFQGHVCLPILFNPLLAIGTLSIGLKSLVIGIKYFLIPLPSLTYTDTSFTAWKIRIIIICFEYLGVDPKVSVNILQVTLLIRKTRTFEPRNANNSNHASHDDGTDAKEGKLCGCVAFVVDAIFVSILSLLFWPWGCEMVEINESKKYMQIYKLKLIQLNF